MIGRLFIIFLGVVFPAVVLAVNNNNLLFHGTLVNEPCSLDPNDQLLTIDFSSVIIKSLYSQHKTISTPFTLHLLNCDTTIANTVNILFTGEQDSEQAGLLANAGTAKGVAIAVAESNGDLIALNSSSRNQPLTDGNTNLSFLTYVQASSVAIANKNITAGTLSATMTFALQYP